MSTCVSQASTSQTGASKKTLKKSKVSKIYWYSWRNQTRRLKEGPRVTRDWNSKIVAPSALSKKLRTLKNDDRILLMPEISHYGRLNAAHIQSKCICMDMESLNGSNFCDMKLAGYLKYNSQKSYIRMWARHIKLNLFLKLSLSIINKNVICDLCM